jgi:anaerobic selenocysteine-containing dehydrogenase
VETLLDNPHGIDLGPLQPDLPNAIMHEDKRIHLCFNYFMADLDRVQKELMEQSNDHEWMLIGRRHLKSNNTWLHNNARMVKGSNICSAQIHPDSAKVHGIQDGQKVKVTSRVGEIVLDAEITDAVMPGVVSIPHGWGHKFEETNWQTAKANAGVSCNDLTDHMFIDALSGNAALNGVPVSVTPV